MADRATPKPERSHAIPPWWRIAAAAALVCLLLSFASSGFADNYYRGNYTCEGFREMEQDYRADPTDVNMRMGYAGCLLTKREDSKALGILHNIVDNSTEPERVKAAWMVAEYISTGGTFEDTIDRNNVTEAIEAYLRIVFFINLDTYYPHDGNELYEEESQIELRTNYRIPLLYFEKFKKGATGTENIHLLRSPNYEGERDLNTYPEYNPYTIDSLEQMIVFANQCLALPPKRHFQTGQYEKSTAGCQVLKEAATALLPLEQERLVLLDTNSCGDDLPQCSEYYEIKDEMLSIIVPALKELNKIFG